MHQSNCCSRLDFHSDDPHCLPPPIPVKAIGLTPTEFPRESNGKKIRDGRDQQRQKGSNGLGWEDEQKHQNKLIFDGGLF
jgi:hypothetical protein